MRALTFPINLYIATLAAGFVTAFASLPLWRKVCIRFGLVDDPGHRKIHDSTIPLAGGLAVLTGILVPLCVGVVLLQCGWVGDAVASPVSHGLSRRALQLGAIAFGAVAMTVIGLLDDRHELKPLMKFAGQSAVALVVALAGVRVTLFVPNEVFSHAITILWILTVVNAFNFMDNMNGLCAGLGVIGAALFGVIASQRGPDPQGQYLVAGMAFLVCGALAGFLPHNYPKARAFLGDSGSHLTGYLLAVMAILPHFHSEESPRPLAVLSPLLVLALPLADMAWVVVARTIRGVPFYIGDTNHLSHRLVRAGLSRGLAVFVIWVAAVAVGLLALI